MSSVTFPNGETFASSAITPDGLNNLLQPLVASILGIDPVADPSRAYSAVRVGWQPQGQPAWQITEDVCIIRSEMAEDPFGEVRDRIWEPNNSSSITDAGGFTQVWKVHFTLYGPNCQDNGRLIVSAQSLDWVRTWTQGAITGVSVASPGAGYVAGDKVSVSEAGAYNGQLQVSSVGLSGTVSSLVLVPASQGYGYATSAAVPTTGGTGTGLTANITASSLYSLASYPRPIYAPELFMSQWWKRSDFDLLYNELVLESTSVSSAAGVNVTLVKESGLSTSFNVGQ